MSRLSRRTLGVFAKYWQPGTVKTRLARSLGSGRAAKVHRLLLRTTLVRLAPCAGRRVLVYTPRSREKEFSALCPPEWQTHCQADGDLGERMASFIDSEIQAAASAVILLGSDAPDLPCDHLQRADDLVTKNDVVLGPCRDGGYYLVGVGAGTWLHDPDIAHLLFDDIPWGTSAVLEITLQRLMQSRRSFACLPPWCDVDEPADLQALCARIDAAQPPDPLAELAESLKRIVGGRLSRG